MKKYFLLISLCFLLPVSVFAVDPAPPTEYILLAPVPNISGEAGSECVKDGKPCATAKTFIPGLFKLMIGLATAMAVVTIMFGGIQYIATAASEGKSDAKKTIENALWGLMLALAAWLILYTINPKLVEFNLDITPQPISPAPLPGTTGGTGTPLTTAQIIESNRIRDQLEDQNVYTNNGPCFANVTTGCTNLNRLPPNAITGLINLKTNCDCSVTITGGTEGGHATHGPGNPIVDLRPDDNLTKYITGNANVPSNNYRKIMNFNGHNVTFTYESAGGGTGGTSTGAHWHTVIN